MKKYVILLFLSFGLFHAGCKQGKNEKLSEGILPREKFIEVLKDCQLAEASVYVHKTKEPENIGSYTKHVYKAVFDKHQITEAQFKANIDYYKSRPTELLQIYSNLVDSLSKMQSTLIREKKQE